MARSRMTMVESTRILALAPGKETETCTLGGATSGNCEMGRVTMASPPMNRMSSEMTIASAGRCRNFVNTSEDYLFLFGVVLQVAKCFFGGEELVFDLAP